MTLYPEEDGWVAVEVMIEKTLLAEILDQLVEVGAHDIMVVPLLNTRTTD
jgi:ATP phosphoribosyltransferase